MPPEDSATSGDISWPEGFSSADPPPKIQWPEGFAPAAKPSEEPSMLGSGIRGAVHGIAPAVGAMAGFGAGAEFGAAAGSFLGPPGAIIGGVGGALVGGLIGAGVGGYGAGKAQEYALAHIPESAKEAVGMGEEQQRAARAAHPRAYEMGELAPNLALLSPSAAPRIVEEGATAFQRLAASPWTARGAGAALMGGQDIASQAIQGEPIDWTGAGISAGAGAIMQKPRPLGEAISELGAAPARRIMGHGAVPTAHVGATSEEGTAPVPPEIGTKIGVMDPTGAEPPADMTVARYSSDGKITYLADQDENIHPMATNDLLPRITEPSVPPTAEAEEQPPAPVSAAPAEEPISRLPPAATEPTVSPDVADEQARAALVEQASSAADQAEAPAEELGDRVAKLFEAPEETPEAPSPAETPEAAPLIEQIRADQAEIAKTAAENITQPPDGPRIIEGNHTKTGAPIVTVQLPQKVGSDEFKALGTAARQLGGYYSAYRGRGALPGFIFKTRDAAEQFAATARGETPAPPVIAPTAAVPEATPPALASTPRDPRDIGHEIARARDEPNGKVDFHGLPFVMENPEGSIRRGVGSDGTPWEVEMPADYGFLAKSEGADGEGVDAYLGPHPESGQAFVVDQVDANTGAFDEHKVMLGFNSWPEARATYERAFSDGRGGERIGNVTPMTLSEIKTWLRNSDLNNPIGQGEFGFERIAPKAPEAGTPTEAKAPPFQLADMVTAELEAGRSLNAKQLQDMAERAFGGKLSENKFARDQMYDGLELGVNQHVVAHPIAFNPRADLGAAETAVRELEGIKQALPTQTVRAGEKDRFQQFSTPPDYSYAAAWLANIRPEDRVLEPSAGNGSLVAMAKNAEPSQVIANELFIPRAEALDALGTDRTFRENAEQLHNVLPPDVKPSLVLMNPPFSATAGRMGDRTVLMTGARHIDQALARLEPGGRLVAIVGRGMTMDAPTFRNWWANTLRNYDVRANVGIPGSVYQKYGTNFGTRLLVIDKVPPSGRPVVTGDMASLPEAMEALDAVRTDRPGIAGEQVATQPAGVEVAQPGQRAVESRPAVPSPTPVGGVRGEPVDTRPGGQLPGGPAAGIGPTPGLQPEPRPGDALVHEQPERPGPGGAERHLEAVPGAVEDVGGSGATPDGVVLRPEGGTGSVLPAGGEPPSVEPSGEPAGPPPETVRVDQLAADPTPGAGVTEAVYEPYKPRISVEGAQPHPGHLVQSAAMASVQSPATNYIPRLPKSLITSGALSDAQLEAIINIGNSHSQMLPANAGEVVYRRGAMLGDGTGAGKGRSVAGVILDNFQQGRQKALWVSEKKSLINDATRDWTGLGGQRSDLLDIGKVKAGGDMKAARGIGFMTYDTLKGAERVGKDSEGKTIKGQSRLDQIVKWLGPDFDGVIAFDECVPAGTMIASPRGPIAIEELAIGDTIFGFDHCSNRVVPTKVKRTFKRRTLANLRTIGPVQMTGNHPVWTENGGYIPAIWIDPADRVRYLSQDGKHTYMRKLREGIPRQVQAQQKSFLQPLLYGKGDDGEDRAPTFTYERGKTRRNRPGCHEAIEHNTEHSSLSGGVICISSFGAQSFLRSSSQAEGTSEQSPEWIYASQRGEWARSIRATAASGGTTRLDSHRICRRYQTYPSGVSAQLQNRYRGAYGEDSYRGRRRGSQRAGGQTKRREKSRAFTLSGMDRVTIYQSGDLGEFRRGCGHRLAGIEVFNIETGTENYFANGLLVHNSHNMANATKTQGDRGAKDASQKALAGIELQKKLPNARVVYVSATGATEVSNLAYAERLGLWGRGTAFPNVQAFIENIGSGGIAAMELVARDMKAMGSYLSRNLSYDDVKYDRIEHQLSPDDKTIYDGLADGWQHVLRNINAALQLTGAPDHTGNVRPDKEQKKNALSAFWGAHQRFFNRVITSMQMPTIIRGVENDLKEGRQAVLQLVNTNEASQKRAIEKRRAAEGEGEDIYEDLDLTPRDQLMQMVDKSFPTQQTETYVDENGNERSRPVVDSKGNAVHNPQAVKLKEALLEKIGSLRVPDGPLERLLNYFGPDKVAEVTGRKERIVHVPDKDGVVRAMPETRGVNTNPAEAAAFQNAKKPILVFSEAGGTGASYHADNTSPSAGAQRSHYLVQAGWRADKAIQGFGRTHRTNQASAPIFHLVTTDLQGQKRFISSIARRLSQLGALTKGERRAGDQGLFSAKDNLESPEAHAALRDFWRSLQGGRVEGIDPRDFTQQTGLALTDSKGGDTEPPEIPQFLNRLLSLKYDMQNQVFGEFGRRLSDAVDRAAAAGTLDTGTETLRGDRISKSEEKTVYTDPQSGAETKYVRLKVDTKNKPATFDQVSTGRRLTAGRVPEFYALSKRSGKVYAVSEASSQTDAKTGRIIDNYRLTDPLQFNYTSRDRMADDRYWERIDDERQARQLWEQQLKAIPEYNSEDVHLITGAVLPIWDRLKGIPKVYRLQTSDGERMLGRVIDNKSIDQTLQALGTETAGKTYAPQEVADRIMRGDRATLANGWTLKRSIVAGEPRIEVVGPNYTHRDELANDGVYTERIQYDTRFFVPTGEQAGPTLERILERRPVTDMASARQADLAEEVPRGWDSVDTGKPYEGLEPARDTTADAKQFRLAGSYGDDLADGHNAARDYVMHEGGETGREYYASNAPDGQIVDAGTSGWRDAIKLSADSLRRMWDPNTPAEAVHHNHPSDHPLSAPDMVSLAAPGVASITAHGHDGAVSSASLTAWGREQLAGLGPKEAQELLSDFATIAQKFAARGIDPLVERGMIPEDRADILVGEARNRLMAGLGVIDYVSTRELPGWLRTHLDSLTKEFETGDAIRDRLHRSAGALRPEDAMGRISETHARLAAGRPPSEGGATAGARGAGESAATERPAGRLAEEAGGGGQPPPAPPSLPPSGFGTPEERRAALDAVHHTDRTNIFDKLRDLVTRIREGGLTGALQYWQDDLKQLERVEKTVGGGQLLPKDISPTAMTRFARNYSTTVDLALRHTQLRYNPDTHVIEPIAGSKGLEAILGQLRPLKQQGMDDFKLWAIVQRAERLKAEGRERNVSDDTINRYRDLDKAYAQPDGTNIFQKVHTELQTYNRNLLNLGENTGIINREGRALFEHDDYVPFFRALNDDATPQGGRGGSRGLIRSPIQQLRGGEAKVNDIFENLAMNTTAMVRRSMENIARRATVTQLSGTEALTPLSRVARDELKTPEVMDRLRDMGLDPDTMDAKAKKAAKDLFGALKKQDPDLYSVLQDGKPLYYRINDPQLLRSIASFGPASMDTLTRILSGPARLLRSAVVFDPAFALAHNLRMAMHAWTLTGTSPFASIGNAIRLAGGGLNETALKMMAAGAVSGRYDIGVSRAVRRHIESPEYQSSLIKNAVDAAQFLKRIGEAGMRASDLGPRMAVYQKALRDGATEAEALDRARDLLDFSTHGDGGAARFLVQTIPFLNARWQGIARTGRGLVGDDRNGLLLRGAMVTAATLALWYENHNDPEYQQKEDWDKQYAWQFKVAPGVWFRLPKFYELGALFGSIPEIIADYFDKGQYGGGSTRQLQNAAVSLFSNVFKFNPIPVAIRPIAEAYFNTDTFTGRPIVNEAEQRLEPSLQYGPATSPSVVAATQGFNAVSPEKVSPEIVQHLIRGYLAGWGGYITAATDAIGESGGWLKTQAAWRAADYPIINRFVHEEPEAGNRIQTDFYNLKNEMSRIGNSIKSSEVNQDHATAQSLQEKHPEWSPGVQKGLEKFGTALAKERKALALTLRNPGYTSEAKRKALDQFYVTRDKQLIQIEPLLRQAQGLPPQP